MQSCVVYELLLYIIGYLGGFEMNIEERIYQLCKKLVVLGYYPFQVKHIMQTAIGNNEIGQVNSDQQLRIINVLENYEKLANDFSFAYSK